MPDAIRYLVDNDIPAEPGPRRACRPGVMRRRAARCGGGLGRGDGAGGKIFDPVATFGGATATDG